MPLLAAGLMATAAMAQRRLLDKDQFIVTEPAGVYDPRVELAP